MQEISRALTKRVLLPTVVDGGRICLCLCQDIIVLPAFVEMEYGHDPIEDKVLVQLKVWKSLCAQL